MIALGVEISAPELLPDSSIRAVSVNSCHRSSLLDLSALID